MGMPINGNGRGKHKPFALGTICGCEDVNSSDDVVGIIEYGDVMRQTLRSIGCQVKNTLWPEHFE
jgi:hypothetical protein